jgi:D-glycero-D-manno-heptose 1,7-bisphosphate phosphatase
MRRAVFLDRDGVINRALVHDGKPFAPVAIEALEILPGVAEALAKLRDAGFLNIVVTNQPDISTGRQTREALQAMHAQLSHELALDSIKVCPHVDADHCACRKPKCGMIVDAARELNVDLGASYMVGDRWRDIVAGQEAGCRCFFIDYGYAEKHPPKPYVAVQSLPEAAGLILSGKY